MDLIPINRVEGVITSACQLTLSLKTYPTHIAVTRRECMGQNIGTIQEWMELYLVLYVRAVEKT